MTNNNATKQFDCIKMKTDIQRQVYDETKNMSVQELLRYFNGNGKRTDEPAGKRKTVEF